MTIIDVDRLSKVAKGIPELERHLSLLIGFKEGQPAKSIAHDQHLELLGSRHDSYD